MTEVIIRIRNVVLLGSLMVSGAIRTWPQDVPAAEVRTPKTAEALYLQLRNVGLDKSRVYRVREGSLDRSGLHITLQDGTIAFTHDVFGHITGGFFEGDGEVLMTSPDRAERASMAKSYKCKRSYVNRPCSQCKVRMSSCGLRLRAAKG